MSSELVPITDDLYVACFIVDTFSLALFALALLAHWSPKPSQQKRYLLLAASVTVYSFTIYGTLLPRWSPNELYEGVQAFFEYGTVVGTLTILVTMTLPFAFLAALIYMRMHPIQTPARRI